MDLMEAVLARSRAARIRAERDRFEAARAAAWDAAAARGPHALIMTGATGTTLSSGLSAEDVNGAYDCVPAERTPGGAPAMPAAWHGGRAARRRGGGQIGHARGPGGRQGRREAGAAGQQQ